MRRSRLNRKLTIKTLIALLTLVLVASSCSGDEGAKSPDVDGGGGETPELDGEPLLIGLDADVTGPSATFIIPTVKTIEATIDEINQSGGVAGRPLELIKANSESDPTKAPAVLHKLADDGAKFILILSGNPAPPKQAIEEIQIPTLSPQTPLSAMALPPDNTYSYTLWNPMEDWADIYCGAFEAADINTVAFLSDDTAAIATMVDILLDGGLSDCIEVAGMEEGSVTASDLSAQATRLQKHDADAIFVASVGGSFEVAAHNAISEMMPTTPRFTLAGLANDPSSWDLVNPGGLEGLVGLGQLDPTNPKAAELVEFLQRAYGDDYRATGFDTSAYTAVQLIAAAFEKAADPDDPISVNEALQALGDVETWFGQPGYFVSYTGDKHEGATSACGLVLLQWDSNNEPSKPWDVYQPSC